MILKFTVIVGAEDFPPLLISSQNIIAATAKYFFGEISGLLTNVECI
jgi:hypothetical protein